MDLDSLRTIRARVDDRVGIITLNRPERLNAYTPEMGVELFSTIERFDGDDEVRAIVITGEGRAFCAGADLAAGGATFAGEATWAKANEVEARVRPWKMRTPIIVAINGPAVGVGATLPLQWDIRIASDRAKLGFLFTRRGITPEAGSSWVLPRLIGMSAALEVLMTGRMLSADEALRLGLVSRVVAHESLLDVAIEMARDIAHNTAPLSVALTKQLVWRQLMNDDPNDARVLEERVFAWIGKQADAAEGVTAFLEKRAPRWSMRPSIDAPTWMPEVKE